MLLVTKCHTNYSLFSTITIIILYMRGMRVVDIVHPLLRAHTHKHALALTHKTILIGNRIDVNCDFDLLVEIAVMKEQFIQ